MNRTIALLDGDIALETLLVTFESFPLADAFVTEIQTKLDGSLICRGIANTAVDSVNNAREALFKRLSYPRDFDRMVGG